MFPVSCRTLEVLAADIASDSGIGKHPRQQVPVCVRSEGAFLSYDQSYAVVPGFRKKHPCPAVGIPALDEYYISVESVRCAVEAEKGVR